MPFGLCVITLELIKFARLLLQVIIKQLFNSNFTYLDSEMIVKIQQFQLSKSYYSSVIQIKLNIFGQRNDRKNSAISTFQRPDLTYFIQLLTIT